MILKDFSIWEIGDGKMVHIWKDKWIPDENGNPINLPRPDSNSNYKMVNDLMCESRWNIDTLKNLFEWDIVAKILSITPKTNSKDNMRWIDNNRGEFTSKSLYNLLDKKEIQPTEHLANKIWRLNVIPRIQFFIWKMKNRMLPFNAHLDRYSIHVNPNCPLCSNVIETGEHSLMNCPFTRAVWSHCHLNLDIACTGLNNLTEWCNSWFVNNYDSLCFTICWFVWKTRCDAAFRTAKPCPSTASNLILSHLNDVYTQNSRSGIIPKTRMVVNPTQNSNTHISFAYMSVIDKVTELT